MRRLPRLGASSAANGAGKVSVAREWIIAPPDRRAADLAARLQVDPLIAQCLLNRGVACAEEARRHLNPSLNDLLPPEDLPGAEQAARRIAQAVRDDRPIVIYGDYDVDGTAGTAILWHVLTLAGARVGWYIPHRLEEGYGLNRDALNTLADEGARLVVTVDCGITAVEEARVARERGVELIITDHHTPGPEAPEALIVHPQMGDGYANPWLCGAGVALKLAWALARELSGALRVEPAFRNFLRDAVSLVALATIADVVPLTGENRILAHHGLAALPRTGLSGLRALIDVSGLADARRLSSYDVGFRLAPRMNAAGRMGHARLVVELLTRASPERCVEIARYLDEQNRRRQNTERQILEQACRMVEQRGMDRDSCRGIVLASPEWHAGVVGIVAARLVERFGRPTILIAVEDGLGQGSGRSREPFHLYEALNQCREHLTAFGGHARAAGVKLPSQAIDAFTEAFIEVANRRLTARDLVGRLRLDAEVPLHRFTEPVVEQIHRLGPFGEGNPRPRFATPCVEVLGEPRVVGRQQNHLQFTVRDEQAVRKCIAFDGVRWHEMLTGARRCRLAVEPIINEFRGERRVEMQVIDIRPA